MIARIDVPEEVRDGSLLVVASVSGGKDSGALILALREAGVPVARYVHADTGWEAPGHAAFLDRLRESLGITIDEVGHPGGMLAKIRKRAGFPGRLQRWCTAELKLQPLRAYHDALLSGPDAHGIDGTVSAMGVRADESAARAKMPEWEDDDEWGGWVWRPLLRWTVEDVLAIHARHGVPINPLYHRGHDRVGCYPCIYSGKEELRIIAEHAPERIDEIEALEAECTAERAARNVEHATAGNADPRYAHPKATFFQTRFGVRPMGIREVVEWAGTAYGGRQLQLLAPPPTGGCMRWGMCEPPTPSSSPPPEDPTP